MINFLLFSTHFFFFSCRNTHQTIKKNHILHELFIDHIHKGEEGGGGNTHNRIREGKGKKNVVFTINYCWKERVCTYINGRKANRYSHQQSH